MEMQIMASKSIPELLAPAGSMDALKAAVYAGADAVYLSGKSFGARHYADNFSKAEMEEAMDYAHLHDLKAYITVNTLIKDVELEKVAKYLFWLYERGADAVILQDVGVASLCRELVADMDMHASTQMSINSWEGVKWARDFGFKRVVLAREMKLPEIEDIVQRKSNKIELEIFAHGALCYSYSGQCLLSSLIGGRSGNRGRCAQPCRKSYKLVRGRTDRYGKPTDLFSIPLKEDYLLSTHDLSLYDKLNRIWDLGVDSLKIEGRMRSAEYVAIVVSIYRKALEALSHGKWSPNDEDMKRLKLAFNRGFTQGYLLETDKELVMGRKAPGNRGLYLGKVSGYIKKDNLAIINPDGLSRYNLKNRYRLEKNDGIVFICPDTDKKIHRERKLGMLIEETPKYEGGREKEKLLLKTKKPVQPGCEVYITRDVSLIKEANDIIHGKSYEFSIPLNMRVLWDEGNVPILVGDFSLDNSRKHEIYLKADFKMEPSIKSPLTEEKIINQLKKTGNTLFSIQKLEIEYPGNLFIPLSKLNGLRRDFLMKAQREILNDHKPFKNSIKLAEKNLKITREELKNLMNLSKISLPNSPLNKLEEDLESADSALDIAVYVSSLEAMNGALDSGCRRIYFEPFLWEHHDRELSCNTFNCKTYTEMSYELIIKAQKLCDAKEAIMIWKWPSITRESYIKHFSPLVKPLSDKGLKEIMIGNMGALRALNDLNHPIKFSGSVGLNIWNHKTVCNYSPLLSRVTLSNELSREELALITAGIQNKSIDTCFDFVVQGNLESIVSEDCVLSILTPHKQREKYQFWGLKDVKKRVFPVIIDDEGRTHILNSVELCLIDHIPDLYQIGLKHLVIDARSRTEDYAQNMVALYKRGIKYVAKKGVHTDHLEKLKIRVKKLSQGGITTGNFIKGLNENL